MAGLDVNGVLSSQLHFLKFRTRIVVLIEDFLRHIHSIADYLSWRIIVEEIRDRPSTERVRSRTRRGRNWRTDLDSSGRWALHTLCWSDDEEFFGVFVIDYGVGDLFRVDDFDVNRVTDLHTELFQLRPGNVDPA